MNDSEIMDLAFSLALGALETILEVTISKEWIQIGREREREKKILDS